MRTEAAKSLNVSVCSGKCSPGTIATGVIVVFSVFSRRLPVLLDSIWCYFCPERLIMLAARIKPSRARDIAKGNRLDRAIATKSSA